MIEIRSFRDIVRLYFIFQKEFRLALWATVIVAVLGAFLLPYRYESESQLLVKPGRDNDTVPIEYTNRRVLVSPSTQRDPVTDEESLLTGRSIVRAVARYYLDNITAAPPATPWQKLKRLIKKMGAEFEDQIRELLVSMGVVEAQSAEDRLATKLAKSFKVVHASGSMVMDVSFTWDDPVVAQRVMGKWVGIYLDQRTKALERKSLYDFYASQSQRLARRIADTKDAIARYLLAVGGSSSKERLDALTQRIEQLQNRRTDAFVQLLGLQQGVRSAKDQMNDMPLEITSERQLDLSPAWRDMSIKMGNFRQQRESALREYMSGTQPITDIDAQIIGLKSQMAEEKAVIPQRQTVVPNDLVGLLKRDTLQNNITVSELKKNIIAYDDELGKLGGERKHLLQIEPELSSLEDQLAVDEKNFALYLNSLENARIDQELDKNRISNIAVIEQATYEPARVFPKSLIILLVALPAGVAVGLFAVYLSYLLDQRIHDGGKMQEKFGVPLWSALMEMESLPSTQQLFQAGVQRLSGLLPPQRILETGLIIGLTSAKPGEGVTFVANAFLKVLQERKISARIGVSEDDRARPGEVIILDAASLSNNQKVFTLLKHVDLLLLVVEARRDTVPVVDNALSMLKMAFGRVDGIILNRRRLEIPASLWSRLT